MSSVTDVQATAEEVAALREHIAELEEEVEKLEDALCSQEFRLIWGYIVAVWPVGDGTYLATCPTLYASVQEDSQEAALASVREAMTVVREVSAEHGWPLPPRDVDSQWLPD